MSKKTDKNETRFVDDGRTVADMNVKGFGWHVPEPDKHKRNELMNLKITKSERKAMIKGALTAILPDALAFIGIFTVVLLVIFFWL